MPTNLVYLVTDSTVANKFGLEQVKYLSKSNLDIHFICGLGSLDPEIKNICKTVTQLKSLKRSINLFNDFKSLLVILVFIHRIKPSCVIYATPKASLLASASSFILGIDNRIYQIWGARWETLSGLSLILVKEMDKLAIKLSTSIIGVSASISDLYGAITKKDILVLGKGSAVGVDKDIFSMNGRNPEPFKLGFAGRIAQDKGISELLIIYKKLKKVNYKTSLEIIGEIDYSDPVDVSLIKEIESDPSINWIRHCSRIDLANHMKRWALQILLSQREGLGNVIIEAGACGIPTICWDVTGVRDAIPDFLGENLIENNRMDLLYSRIKRYLDNPLSTMEASKLSSWTIENFERNKVLSNFANHVNHKILEMNSRD